MNKQINVENVVLKTDRLTLRPWKLTDVDDMYEYAKVDGVGQMAGWIPHKTIEDSRAIVNMFIQGKNQFAIEYMGKVIGSLGIEKYDEKVITQYSNCYGCELGFVLSKDYWNKGIMTEAVKSVINYLFNCEKVDFIICSCFNENVASYKVQEKCGFKKFAEFKYTTRYDVVKDSRISVLLKEDYDKDNHN